MKKILFVIALAVFSASFAMCQDTITPANKRGLVVHTLTGKFGIRIKSKHLIFEDNIKVVTHPQTISSVPDGAFRNLSNETRLLYSFKRSSSKRFYAGVGIDFFDFFYGYSDYRGKNYLYIDNNSFAVFGIEIFPFKKMRQLSISPEIFWNFANPNYGHYGLNAGLNLAYYWK